ncbi:MAG: SMI1-KNR4 domain-containing protein [Virgibacillus proomii]
MYDFEFLNKYVSEINNPQNQDKKHIINRLEDDVIEVEKRLGKKFPNELREFYLKLGYGFICNFDKTRRNRLMDPHSIADFILGEDDYIDSTIRDPDNLLLFFLKLEREHTLLLIWSRNKKAGFVLFTIEEKIATSLEEFLKRMDEETDYYIHLNG